MGTRYMLYEVHLVLAGPHTIRIGFETKVDAQAYYRRINTLMRHNGNPPIETLPTTALYDGQRVMDISVAIAAIQYVVLRDTTTGTPLV